MFFVVGFSLLMVAGSVWANRWTRPLARGPSGPDAAGARLETRRRAILLPYVIAGISAVGWTLAGLIWGVLWPLAAGHFAADRALRQVFGITFVSGLVTTAFVFFAIERLWRKELPAFFPDGDVSAVPGVVRLRVRTRLLVIFLMLGTVPLSLLGVMAYRRALALLETDPAAAGRLVDNMLVTIVFIVGVGVVILFADLRDFTPWVEATDPREVVRDLNRYFTEMNEAIRGHRGLVLQFIGDEIEAVFGAPLADPALAGMALSAALQMRERLARLNAERARAGKPPLRHGIGIHTGRVLAGNIGSAERLSYALVGDAVNLASRIQDLNKQFGSDILVSGTTRALLDGTFALAPLPAARVKGRSVEVEIYRLA